MNIEIIDELYYIKNGKKCRKVQDVGINDADYRVDIKSELPKKNGKRQRKQEFLCHFYTVWKGMLCRCYRKHKNYSGVTVCDEWLIFSNFKSWMEKQDWQGKELDKDLLMYQNNIYSPDTCLLVDKEINQFLVTCEGRRGQWYLGVDYSKKYKKYRARISGQSGKTSPWLGYFEDQLSAHQCWQRAKIQKALELYNKQKDPKIKQGLIRVMNKIKHDLDNNLITEDV